MAHHIKTLLIENFKSIKHLELRDCATINIFVGKPNVGKSSILEALSLLGNHAGERFFSDLVHYESLTNLFYDQEIQARVIEIYTNVGSCKLKYDPKANSFEYNRQTDGDNLFGTAVTNDTKYIAWLDSTIPVHRYEYRRLLKHDNPFPAYLKPPFGDNLVSILQTHADIRTLVSPLFEQYGVELVMDVSERVLKIQRRKDGLAYSLPYSLVADTLQRMILFMAAMYSNKGAVLLFEEPEAHAFPPYIKMLADHIALDDDNQYFLTTHSPYLLQTLARETEANVAVFVVDIVEHETVARRIEGEHLQRLIDEGSSVFFNLERL